MDARSLLSRYRALRGLPTAHLDALAAAFVEREHRDGDVVIGLGSRGRRAYLLVDGAVSVTVETGGVERELAQLGPGALLGHIALYDGAPASATCRVAGRARLGHLSGAAFALLTRASSEIAYAFQRAVAEQVAADYRALVARDLAL